MSEAIKFKLKHSTRINYVMASTGDPGFIISTNGKLLLSIGRVYQIPVDSDLCLDDFNVFKTIGIQRETVDVRNIRDGYAHIYPIVHNTLIQDGEILGSFI